MLGGGKPVGREQMSKGKFDVSQGAVASGRDENHHCGSTRSDLNDEGPVIEGDLVPRSELLPATCFRDAV